MHPVLTNPTPATLAEIPALASEGHTSLKVFMVREYFEPQIEAFLAAMQAAAESGCRTLVHCEDGPTIRHITAALLARGAGSVRDYPDSRPDYTEVSAIERAVAFARASGASLYVVHLSSAAALDVCRRARDDGVSVSVETRPLYLYLTRERFEEPDGAKYVGYPPLRGPRDVRVLWHGLAHGDIDCVCTDHLAWTLQQKLVPNADIRTFRAGVAELETLLPMLFSEGVLPAAGSQMTAMWAGVCAYRGRHAADLAQLLLGAPCFT